MNDEYRRLVNSFRRSESLSPAELRLLLELVKRERNYRLVKKVRAQIRLEAR